MGDDFDWTQLLNSDEQLSWNDFLPEVEGVSWNDFLPEVQEVTWNDFLPDASGKPAFEEDYRKWLYGKEGYGEGMTGQQTARYDYVLEKTGSKELANLAATKGFDTLTKAFQTAKNVFGSPAGMASIGALLGAADRQRPSGGGTTMAYQGPAELKRKIVQGPYGPIAEYEGVGGGSPDYTRFAAPTVRESAPAPRTPTGQTAQQKADLYKFMRDSIGMSDAQIRQFANYSYGDQKDSDWQELLRIVGGNAPVAAPKTTAPVTAPVAAPVTSTPGTKPRSDMGFTRDPDAVGGMAMVPWYNKKTGQTYIASDTAWRPPNEDWVQGEFDSTGGVKKITGQEPVTSKPPIEDSATFTGPPSLQVSQSSTPQQKAQEYQRLRQFGMSDSQIRAMVDAQMGKQNDSDWQYLKNLAGETAATATARKPTGEVVDQDTWNKNAAFATRGTKNRPQPLAVWRDPTSGAGVAVIPNDEGVPAELMYLSSTGEGLYGSAFNAPDLYKSAEKLGMDLSNISQLGSMLDEKGVGYKPYELYKGTGSDHGIDFQDIAQGGLGTAYDWTKDPLAHLKGPTGQTNLAENQALAQRLGINKNVATTTEQGIDPTRFTTLMAGSDPRSNVAFTGGTASWYDTPQEAQNYLTKTGVSGQVYDTSSGTPTVIPAAQPAAPRDLRSLLPSDWGSITDPSKKIDWFNQQKATQAELERAGVTPEEIAWMRQNKLGTYANGGITQGYAHGGEARAYAGGKPLTMEDGGFVFTKKATDKLGRRGIAALGGKMISAPGNGTDDKGITGIIGKNGVTPARVSNGESYFPPGHDTKKLYALMKSLERNA